MRLRTLALTAVASLGLLAFGAASASAAPAPLPASDTLFGIACPYFSSDDSQLPNMQVIKLDAATAAGTLVGSGTPALTHSNCGGQGAFNPVTSTAYAVAQDFTDATLSVLVSVDTVSGVSTFVGDFTAADVPVKVFSIAISPTGVAYAMGDIGTSFDLYTLDLGTGRLTLVGPTVYTNFSLAVDPSTGILYTVDENGYVSSIDTLTGMQTFVGAIEINGIYSFAIDTSGTFWFASDIKLDDNVYEAALYSAKLPDLAGTAELSGTVSVAGTSPYIEALLLTWDVPAPAPAPEPAAVPELAATGAGVDPTVFGSALLLLVTGITAVAFRRTRRA
ncbi:MAG: hypothetical protein JWO10_747 [Microbacteriaceae bacterium]|nr:hypothetical protein [Microbacteriaceae bacterium]